MCRRYTKNNEQYKIDSSGALLYWEQGNFKKNRKTETRTKWNKNNVLNERSKRFKIKY